MAQKIIYLNQTRLRHSLNNNNDNNNAINHNRSHIILFSPPNPLIKTVLGSLVSNVKLAARDLGVIFYSYLTFDPQNKRVV